MAIREKGVRLIALFSFLVIALILQCGCGGDSPEAAVKKFVGAWSSSDWEGIKKAVLPEDAKFTKEQEELAKQKFEQIKVKFENVRMETSFDKKDRNKARVVLVSGEITYQARIGGKIQKQAMDIKKMEKSTRPYFDCIRRNKTWYVHRKID
ncbi:MAG: hypothetical protein PHP64_00735 [Actinomycetota bacterium]|nr:hypothetical protein [Actinomycetota bacterium]